MPEHMLPSKETEISIQSWLLEDSRTSAQGCVFSSRPPKGDEFQEMARLKVLAGICILYIGGAAKNVSLYCFNRDCEISFLLRLEKYEAHIF